MTTANGKPGKPKERIRRFGYGRVTGVHSGDSFTVMGHPIDPKVSTKSETKEICISGVQAPMCVRGRSGIDEPYAWESREFLRRLIFGKQVQFNINVQTVGTRAYADVFLDRGKGPENLAELLTAVGWVKPKESKNPRADMFPERQAVLKLQAQAQAEKKGIWSAKSKPKTHVREFVWGSTFLIGGLNSREARNAASDAEFQWAWGLKGKELPAVIQKIRDGSTYRCELTNLYPDEPNKHKVVLINLTGVKCPKVPPPLEVQEQMKNRNPRYVIMKESPPFGLDAQAFASERLLHQDIHVVIDGADKLGNVYGSIKHPKGNISLKLLERGYGKLVPWQASFSPEEAELTKASNSSIAKKVGLWSLPDDSPVVVGAPEIKEWEAKVTEVGSGDSLKFDGGDVRYSLASIKAPRLGRRGEEPMPFYFEAREFVREKIFGKKVKVSWCYDRFDNRFVNVSYFSLHQNKEVDLSEELCADGFADVVIHSSKETRAHNYGKLIENERRAKWQKRHKHGEKNPYIIVFDLTNRGYEKKPDEKGATSTPASTSASTPASTSAAPAKKGKSRAEVAARSNILLKAIRGDRDFKVVVDYCYSGSRMKVYLPNIGAHGYMFNFVIAGVNCAYPRERGGGAENPWGMKAWQLAKQKLLQQDNIRIGKIEMKDKGDNFLGKLYVGKKDFGLELLKHGFAQVRYDNEGTMWPVQEKAKEAKKGLWKDWVEPVRVPRPARGDRDGKNNSDEPSAPRQKNLNFTCEVTEIMDSTNFFVRATDDTHFAKVQEALANFEPKDNPEFPPEKPSGIVCAGKFSDGQWYRVRIGSSTKTQTYRVMFIDYGNSEELGKSSLTPLPLDVAKIPSTCKTCVLAGIKAPGSSSAYVNSSAIAFNQLAYGHQLTAKVVMEDRSNKLHVTLTPKDAQLSINSQLVQGGWVRVLDRPFPGLKSFCRTLKKDEQIAKDNRTNIWEYGDVSDDEDDEKPSKREQGRPPSLSQKRAAVIEAKRVADIAAKEAAK